MKKLFSILLLVAAVTSYSKAQNGPVMMFEKTEIDYGNVVQNGDGVRIFKFKNIGTEPLIIKNARGSCGCTVPKWPSEPIKPGQSASIEVKYDSNRLGTFVKTVTVETNEEVGKQVLTIKGNIYEKKFDNASNNNPGNRR